MHKSVGVRSALQSLAGIYIYDYQPLESIRNAVNKRFEAAEKRFTQLLNDAATYQDETQANELITIAVILSMQDVSRPIIRKKLADKRTTFVHLQACVDKFTRLSRPSDD